MQHAFYTFVLTTSHKRLKAKRFFLIVYLMIANMKSEYRSLSWISSWTKMNVTSVCNAYFAGVYTGYALYIPRYTFQVKYVQNMNHMPRFRRDNIWDISIHFRLFQKSLRITWKFQSSFPLYNIYHGLVVDTHCWKIIYFKSDLVHVVTVTI